MTSFDPVDVWDLPTPLSLQESGRIEGPESGPDTLVVQGRRRTPVRRAWDVAQAQDPEFNWHRLLSLYETSGYGTLPIRFTPPGEAETSVFIEVSGSGLNTARTAPLSHFTRVTLTEAL